MDNSSFNRNRYNRLYKLTGDSEWLAKYAEEGTVSETKPYKFQNISDFIQEFLDANNEPFEQDPLQGMLGSLAAEAVAEHWKNTQDLDADALKSIELSSKPSDVLADSLLKFTPKDFEKIKSAIKERLSKLEHKQASVAAKLDDQDIENLVKFSVVRGTLYAYWTFVFRNPIVLVLAEGKHVPVSKADAQFDKLIVQANEEDLKDLEQEDEEVGDYDEGHEFSKKKGPLNKKDVEKIKEKNQDRQHRERDIGNLPENYIPISQAIKAMRLVRARHAYEIAADSRDGKLRANYAIADATIQFMETLYKSIQAYVAENPARAGLMISRQRLGGVDGKGDILIATDKNHIGNMPGMFITSLRTGTYRNVRIPWVNHNKEGQVFSARKIAGPVIPGPGSIFPGFIAKKYKNFNAYSTEMLASIIEDLKLLNAYNKKLGDKGITTSTISVVINALVAENVAISEKDAKVIASNVWKIITSKFDNVLAGAQSAEDIAIKCSSKDGMSKSPFVDEVASEVISSIPTQLMPESHEGIRNIITYIMNDMKLVVNPSVVVAGFKPEILQTFSSNVNPEAQYKNFTDAQKAQELFEEATDLIISKIHEIDEKMGFHPDPLTGKVRDQKDYAILLSDVPGGPIDILSSKYSEFIKRKKDGKPLDPNAIKNVVKTAARLAAPDAFTGSNAFGEGWVAVQYNGGGVQLLQYKERLSPKSFGEIDKFAKYEIDEVSKETREDFARVLGEEYVDNYTKKLVEKMAKPSKRIEKTVLGDIGLEGSEMSELMSSGGNLAILSPKLLEKLKAAAGSSYVATKFEVIRQANFSRESAAIFANVLSSGMFAGVNSKDFKEKTETADQESVRRKLGTTVEDIYKQISASPAAFGLPVKEDPVILSQMRKDPDIRQEYVNKYAMLETLRNWMIKFHASDVHNPRSKLIKHLNSLQFEGMKNIDPHLVVNAMYEYVGQKFVSCLTGIFVPLSWDIKDRNEMVPLLQAAALKAFPKSKTRGGPQDIDDSQDFGADFSAPPDDSNPVAEDEYSGIAAHELYGEDSGDEAGIDNGMRSSDDDTGGFAKEKVKPEEAVSHSQRMRQNAIAETERWVMHLCSKEAQFDIVEIRGVSYKQKSPSGELIETRKMTDEMKAARGWSHLNPHTPGGWVQAAMGDSISPTIGYALKDLRSLIAYGKWATVKSFGNRLDHVNRERAKASWSGPTAKFEDKWHLMEEVGAFADPLWSMTQYSEAMKSLHGDVRESGYNPDFADTAEKHFERAYKDCEQLDPKNIKAELQKYFIKRKGQIIDVFPQLKQKGLGNFIFEYKRIEDVPHSRNYTNTPYAKRGANEMRKMFQFKGITPEQLEAAAQHMKLQSMRDSLVSFTEDINEYADIEELWNKDALMFEKFQAASSWSIESVEQVREAFEKIIPKGDPKFQVFANKEIKKILDSTFPTPEAVKDFFAKPIPNRISILQYKINELDDVQFHGLKLAMAQVLSEIQVNTSNAQKVIKEYHEVVLTASEKATEALKKAEEKRKKENAVLEKKRLEDQMKQTVKEVAPDKANDPTVLNKVKDVSEEINKTVNEEREEDLVNEVMKEVQKPAVIPEGFTAKNLDPSRTVIRKRPEEPALPAAQTAPVPAPAPQKPVTPSATVNRPKPTAYVMPDDDDENMALDGAFEKAPSGADVSKDNTRHVWEDDDAYHVG